MEYIVLTITMIIAIAILHRIYMIGDYVHDLEFELDQIYDEIELLERELSEIRKEFSKTKFREIEDRYNIN